MFFCFFSRFSSLKYIKKIGKQFLFINNSAKQTKTDNLFDVCSSSLENLSETIVSITVIVYSAKESKYYHNKYAFSSRKYILHTVVFLHTRLWSVYCTFFFCINPEERYSSNDIQFQMCLQLKTTRNEILFGFHGDKSIVVNSYNNIIVSISKLNILKAPYKSLKGDFCENL